MSVAGWTLTRKKVGKKAFESLHCSVCVEGIHNSPSKYS